jgi:hypothetical protein
LLQLDLAVYGDQHALEGNGNKDNEVTVRLRELRFLHSTVRKDVMHLENVQKRQTAAIKNLDKEAREYIATMECNVCVFVQYALYLPIVCVCVCVCVCVECNTY